MIIQPIDSAWASQVQALCYVVSQWDREQWQAHLAAFPHVEASLKAGRSKIKGWDLFAEEVFHRLLTVPQPISYDQLRPEVLWAHQLHQWLDESVDFSEMQLACRNNPLAAGQGTYRLIELARGMLPNPPRGFKASTTEEWEAEFVRLQAQLTALVKTQAQLTADLQGETDPQRRIDLLQQLEQIEFDLAELQSRLKSLEQQIGQVTQAAQDYAELIGQALADRFTEAIREALGTVQTFQRSMAAFGWSDGLGTLKRTGDAKTKEVVAQRFARDARFRKIAEAAGRFQAIAALRQGAKRSKHIPDELSDTCLGNTLSRLVPSEWVRAAIDELRPLFLKDYADEALTQSDFDGAADDGEQGPVIICLDKSESMTWNGGKKEIDSTALMLAMVSIAQEQNRRARVILFDEPVRYVKDLDPRTTTPADRLDLADRQYAGGTNFMAPLEKALEALESAPDLREADVIFITDGEADVTDSFSRQWREAQQRLGFKVYTLIVGTYIDTEVLDAFSDQNIFVSDLDDPKVHQVFDI